ncbi:MAG: sialate O-acetylesterase [Planctomycetaceae bacterium]
MSQNEISSPWHRISLGVRIPFPRTVLSPAIPLGIWIILSLLVSAGVVHAELRVPHIFGNGMVLQRDRPASVWGWTAAGTRVTVQFAEQSRTTVADADGTWTVALDAMPATFTGRTLTISDSQQTHSFRDVVVGDVWICGGQSNMEWSLRSTRDADLEIQSAAFPGIRFIRLPKVASRTPQADFPVAGPEHPEGNWRQCIPEQIDNCTAVGYYFARRLRRRLKVPIGLIDVSWGGTMAQHWVSPKTLADIPEMKPYIQKFQQELKAWNDGGGEQGAEQRFAAAVKTWERDAAAAKAENQRVPRRPNHDAYRNPSEKRHPGGMFQGMISPLAKFRLRGALFYQGENNSFAESWKPFPRTFPSVITDWRKVFGQDDLPIGIIQIAGWSNRRSMTYDMNHHTNIVREVQFNTWRNSEHTGLIATYDTNSNGSIHPARKLPVGERAARWALAKVYGTTAWKSDRPIEWRGPIYSGMEVKDGKIIVSFDNQTRRGLRLNRDVETGFYVAGADRTFHHARARVIKDDQLAVWSEAVPDPVAVRYAWSNLPAGGLMNFRELPAYPFRSDTWPLVPHQSTGAYDVKSP